MKPHRLILATLSLFGTILAATGAGRILRRTARRDAVDQQGLVAGRFGGAGSGRFNTHAKPAANHLTVIDQVVHHEAGQVDRSRVERTAADQTLGREVPVVVEEKREARSSFLSRVPRTLVGIFRLRVRLWRED